MRTVQTVVFLGLLVGSFLMPAHGAENVAGQDSATGQPPPPGKIQVGDTTPRFSLREILKLADLSEAQKKRILALQAEYRLKLAEIAVKKIEVTPETPYVDNPFDPSGGVKKFHELSPADKAIVGDRERKRLARRMEDEFAAQVWQVLSCQQRRSLILLALQAPSQLEGGRETIREMVNDYQIQHGIVITLDTEVLRQDKLDPEMVWFPTSLHGTTLDSSLRLALEPLGATHLVRGDTLLITTKAEAQQLLREGAEDPATFPSPAKAARMKQITAALKEPVPTKIRGVPLQGIIERLGDLGKVQVVFDFGCFVPGMVPLDHPALTLDLKPVPLEKALMQLLAPHGLTFIVRDEVIMVVPAKKDRPADGARPPRPEYLSGKITVSSSTTRILGPLDKEGRVDYAAAVNCAILPRRHAGKQRPDCALGSMWAERNHDGEPLTLFSALGRQALAGRGPIPALRRGSGQGPRRETGGLVRLAGEEPRSRRAEPLGGRRVPLRGGVAEGQRSLPGKGPSGGRPQPLLFPVGKRVTGRSACRDAFA